ncbi:SGNH/GDSL hydrolase family protein [Ruegeria arenilitoris]|uniref:SGNH/GDSL hydrolase family protein n=1 Tax=Ruegeria arenilitoris TaxID=1173585 RepID=UPI00147DE935|nr:SGNH/GDSL hydrolase family protein [Ruegeria arenilitoris]
MIKKDHAMPSTMKICVIGGSNSLMADGYVRPAIEMLKNRARCDIELANVSIGGTFSHFGIWQLLSKRPHLDADVIVVEYVLNDAELSAFRSVLNWSKTYEGLVRKLRTEAPRAQIICPLLVNRRMASKPKLSSLVSGAVMINMRYGIETIDVNQEIIQRCPMGSPRDAEGWYRDLSHYAKPFQIMIGEMLASRIAAGAGRSCARDTLPVNLDHFAEARSAVQEGIFDNIVPPEFERKSFQNRLVEETAALVPEGKSFGFKLTGEIVALIIVSTRQDGILVYHHADKSVNVGIYRKAFAKSRFDFLMNVIVPEQYFFGKCAATTEPTVVKVDVLNARAIQELDSTNVVTRPSARMPPNDTESEYSFALVDIVYAGEIAPI